jgi:hypothetical protein
MPKTVGVVRRKHSAYRGFSKDYLILDFIPLCLWIERFFLYKASKAYGVNRKNNYKEAKDGKRRTKATCY